MVCAVQRSFVMSYSARRSLEREIPRNRAVHTLSVNVLAFFIVHPWKHHCYKNHLAGVWPWYQVWGTTFKHLPFSAVVGVLPVQGSPCVPGMTIVRVLHCIHIVLRCVNTFAVITVCTCHICELAVHWELLIFLETEVGSWSFLTMGHVVVGDHSVNWGSGSVWY